MGGVVEDGRRRRSGIDVFFVWRGEQCLLGIDRTGRCCSMFLIFEIPVAFCGSLVDWRLFLIYR